jgi:preprotein translocase subunit SecA
MLLQVVDVRWREHLENMDYLREGIHLRSMAQKDPLVEYRNEGHLMFQELNRLIREEVIHILFHTQIEQNEAPNGQNPGPLPQAANGGGAGALSYDHQTIAGSQAIAAAGAGGEAMVGGSVAAAPRPVVKSANETIGRNDPCWCGSGKKFKRCHGA